MALTTIDDRGLKTPIDLLDNEKIRFGTGNDLQIYHDGNNSYIKDTGTGYLVTNADQIHINNADNSDNMIKAVGNGAVELYYDGSKKFETTSAGVSFSGDTFMPDSESAHYGTGNDMYMGHTGVYSYIENVTGDLRINSNSLKLQSYTSGEAYLTATHNGAVELYYDNSKKLETITNGVKVHTNLYAQGAGEISLAIGSTDAGGAAIYFDGDSNGDWSGGDYSRIRHTTAGDMEYDADNPAGATNHIFMTAGTERLRIDSSGNVGIGCTPSNGVLEVKDTSYDGGSTGLLTLEGGGESGVMFKTSSYGNDQNKIGTNNNGHMFFRVAAGTRASLTSDGLCFGSDTAAANALGDYEEGTFSPQITEGISSQSYSEQHGRYTKIGNKVHLDFYLRINDADANGSHYKIGNFPFTINNSGFVRGGGCTTYFSLNTGASGSNATAQFYGSGGGTYANLYQGSTLVAGTNGAANDALYLIGFFEYTT